MLSYSADNCKYLSSKYNLKFGEYLAVASVFDYQNTKIISLDGNTFSVPVNTAKYLKTAYGNWQEKNKNFDYLKDSEAVRINPTLKATIVYE